MTRRYPAYKDSGVEWLGEVPEEWEVLQIRYLFDCLDGQRIPLNSSERAEKAGPIPYWGANGIVDTVDEALFDEPLVLLGEDGAPFFDRLKDVAFFSEGPIWPNNHVHVLRSKSFSSAKFLTFALNATDFADYIDGSTRDKLTQGQMLGIKLPWPSLLEQTAIAAFLDRETGKIDALLAEQRRLIDLLREKRQAVASHAVTKGVNPNAPLKPSGIDWLGDVPEGWEVVPLRRILSMQSGDAITSEIIEPEGDFPVYGGNGLRGYTTSFTHTGGHILIGRQGALCGNINFATGQFWASEHAVVVTPKHSVDLVWLGETLRVMNLNQYSTSAAQPGLSVDVISRLSLAVPNIEQQTTIGECLSKEFGKIDTLTATAENAIALLQERRAALISAVVTGKIDVRDSVTDEVAA